LNNRRDLSLFKINWEDWR